MNPGFVLDLGLRYGFGRQRSRFTRFVSLASMVGMVLGVASLITVLSVMNGFAAELRARILALVPHGYVTGDATADWPALAQTLVDDPAILATAPYLRETALLSGNYSQRGVRLVGIDPALQDRVTPLRDMVVAGSLDAIEEPFTAVLGIALARGLGVVVGDSVQVVLPQITVTPLGAFPRTRRLRVVGLFEVGAQQDALLAFLSLDSMERLLRRGGERGLQVLTRDIWEAPLLAPALPEGFRYQPWNTTQGSLFRAVRMEKITVAALLFGVVLVAAFNIVATLVMAVAEKRRDIAVLRTMGATPAQVMAVFATQGLALAALGICVGAGAGVLLALNVGDVVSFIERLSGAHLFDPSVYFITRLPSQLIASDVLSVVAGALVLSLLAVVYPSWRAGRVAPAEVLRYE